MAVGMLASPRMPAANSSSSSTSTTPTAPAALAFLVRTAEPQRRAESLSVHESTTILPVSEPAGIGSHPSELLAGLVLELGLRQSARLPSPMTASGVAVAP